MSGQQPKGAAREPAPDGDREVLTGRIVTPRDDTGDGGGPSGQRRTASMFAGDMAQAAGDSARQVSDLLSGTARIVAGLLGVAGLAGAFAAVVIALLLGGAFGWSTTATVVVSIVLALPALEVGVHRFLLLRAYGDPDRLRRRFTDLPDATLGRVQEFAGRVRTLRGGTGRRSGRVFGAARSAGALRGVAGAVPELTGVLLLPLSRTLLLVTAVGAAVCLLLLAATPVVALIALIGALAG